AARLDCSSHRSGGDRSATVAAHLDGGGVCIRSLYRVCHRLGGASTRGKLVLRSCAFVRPSVRTAVRTPRAPDHSRCPRCSALRSAPPGPCLPPSLHAAPFRRSQLRLWPRTRSVYFVRIGHRSWRNPEGGKLHLHRIRGGWSFELAHCMGTAGSSHRRTWGP